MLDIAFKNNAVTVFLDKNSPGFNIDASVNIILSPSLYWVRKLTLPVKSKREIVKLLPSVFDDTLPQYNYSYYAYKNHDTWYGFAYNDKEIIELINRKNLNKSKISNIYFAQTELADKITAIKIDDDTAICSQDGAVITLPSSWVKADDRLDISTIALSKHKIDLKAYEDIIDKSSLYKILAILIVFILIVAAKDIVIKKASEAVNQKTSKIFTRYNLMPTMIQNKSILSSYLQTYRKQIKIRNAIAKILNLRLHENQKLTFLSLNNNTITAIFSIGKNNNTNNILAGLQNLQPRYTVDKPTNQLTIKITL